MTRSGPDPVAPPPPGAPFRPGPALRAACLSWQGIVAAALPLTLCRYWWLGRTRPLYRRHLSQRFGGGMLPAVAGGVWVMAGGADETRVATPLLRALLDRGLPVVLTHTAPDGLSEGQRQFAADIAAGRMRHGHAPFDLGPVLRRFQRRHRPRLALVIGVPVRPVQVIEAARAGIPLVLLTEGEATHSCGLPGAGLLRRAVMPGLAAVLPGPSAPVERTLAMLERWLRR